MGRFSGEQVSTNRTAVERELAQVTKRIEQIVEAVCEGLYHPSMKTQLTELEARKAALEDELAQPGERSMALHPRLVQVWKHKVDNLSGTLNADDTRHEAAELQRTLIDTIRLIPTTASLLGCLGIGGDFGAWRKYDYPQHGYGLSTDSDGCGGRI